MKLLLECKEVSLDLADGWGTTPLLMATLRGHDGIMKLLLERNEVNPDFCDILSRTPLWEATRNGKEGAVRLLLERKSIPIHLVSTSNYCRLRIGIQTRIETGHSANARMSIPIHLISWAKPRSR